MQGTMKVHVYNIVVEYAMEMCMYMYIYMYISCIYIYTALVYSTYHIYIYHTDMY